MSDTENTPSDTGLPPDLRFLKTLVSVLAGVMIVGVITIIALLVIRLPDAMTPLADLPATLTLPDGAEALAVTRGPGWFAIVTRDNRILIYGDDGALRQSVAIATQP